MCLSKRGCPGKILNSKDIEIRLTEEITVYTVNKAQYSTDAFAVFPLDTLGNNYLVITWNNKAAFLIIGSEDNTTVNIVIAVWTHITYDGVTYTAGMTLYITMNKYQTFHVFGGQDYTGTRTTSTKINTVISGAYCTKIGAGTLRSSVFQMTPIDTFGNTIVTINMPNCNSPVNCVASENNTDVNITGRAQNCAPTITVPGDIIDNDCDGLIDEELQDDNDGDGKIDEDLAEYFKELRSTSSSTKKK
ncbi:unnamed protein product [Mytilus edulis]|uniref:IgGFc-binding protein N-terminal domain-containing protein n=1 Tax=Mytilus edulis TaxID=6550 RepID=A0A8S3V8E0_MYTED|nr:unnamed protein product [Mytilus edulis]